MSNFLKLTNSTFREGGAFSETPLLINGDFISEVEAYGSYATLSMSNGNVHTVKQSVKEIMALVESPSPESINNVVN